MIALEGNAEQYLKKVLSALPADHAGIVRERFGDITMTFRKGHIDDLQGSEKITLSQCKGLLASVAEQMPPDIQSEILSAAAEK
jgi:hypothetical protein